MEELKTLSDFEEKVLKNSKPVLVDFFATWCGPCKMISPFIEKISKTMQDKLDVYKVDVDANVDTAAQCAIEAMPTLIIFSQGQEKVRQVGAMSQKDLNQWVAQNL